MDENSSRNVDFKEISERLRRRLSYREQQLSALRQTLKSGEEVPSLLNESFVSNSAASEIFPRVVEEIRRSAVESETAELRLKLREASEQLSFQTRRANLLHQRLSELEQRGVVASSHSRASEEEISRLRLRVAELEGERQSLLSQTAGLEQTRTILKKQIEKISDLKHKARTAGVQTDSGLRLSRDELELRVLRSEVDNKKSEIYTNGLEISRLQTELANRAAASNAEILQLQREIFSVKEQQEQKNSNARRETIRVHTDLTHAHQEQLEILQREHGNKCESIIAEYELKLDVAIRAREDAVKNSAESALAQKCRTMEISLAEISDRHKQELESAQLARSRYEAEVRREMEKLEFETRDERENFRLILSRADHEKAILEKRLSEILVKNSDLDEELARTIGNFKQAEVANTAAVGTLENFCREKDERISLLTVDLERTKEHAELAEKKFSRQLELWKSEHQDLASFEAEKSSQEISRLLSLLETEKRSLAELHSSSAREISDLRAKIQSLHSEISRRDLTLQSEEHRAQHLTQVKDMEISSLKTSIQRLEERVGDLNVQRDRERKEALDLVEAERKNFHETERKRQAAVTRVSELQHLLACKDGEISAQASETARGKELGTLRIESLEKRISDLQRESADDKQRMQQIVREQAEEISMHREEKQEISDQLGERTTEVGRLVELLRAAESRQTEIFRKNVELVESGSNPETLIQLSRQVKLETVSLIDHLVSARQPAETSQLHAEIARLQESRETLSVSAKELCNKVTSLTTKYRRTQLDLQAAKHETQIWHDRYLQRVQQSSN